MSSPQLPQTESRLWHNIGTARGSSLNSVCKLLTTLTLTAVIGCFPARAGPDVLTDAPSAVDASLDTDVAEVRTCDLQREISRILADQVDVVDCGMLNERAPDAERDMFVACVNNAVSAGRPVRSLYTAYSVDASSEIAFLSFNKRGANHAVILFTDRRGPPYGEIRMAHTLATLVMVARTPPQQGLFARWNGSPVDQGQPYDPPRAIPSGATICP